MTSAPGRPEAAGQDFKPLAGQRRLRPDSIRFNEKTDDFVSFTYEKENEAPDTLPPSRNKKKNNLCVIEFYSGLDQKSILDFYRN